MSTNVASFVRVGGRVDGSVLSGSFGIRFHGESLHGLQGRGNGFLIGLGAPHFRVETLINLAQSGIVRADAGHRVFGILRGTGWPGYFFVSFHDSDRRAWGHFSSSGSAQAGESQRRENSIFPSASVGTPLQVAGRYRQPRTVCNTLRSPAGPALCRIRGLRTRPSAPMMKLTLTLRPASTGASNGSGVVKACGGCVSSQRERALVCGMLLNSAARVGVLNTWCSRSVKKAWLRRGGGTCTEAALEAGSARIRNQGQMRSIGETFKVEPQVSCQRAGGCKYIVINRCVELFSGQTFSDVKPIAYAVWNGFAGQRRRFLCPGEHWQ